MAVPKPNGRPVGATTTLSASIAAHIGLAMMASNFKEVAAAYSGANRQTLYRWLNRGARTAGPTARSSPDYVLFKETTDLWLKWLQQDPDHRGVEPTDYVASDDGSFVAFSDLVERWLARAETENVALIRRAASQGNWQAAAWLLERTCPERWGRDKVGSSVEPGQPAIGAPAGSTTIVVLPSNGRETQAGMDMVAMAQAYNLPLPKPQPEVSGEDMGNANPEDESEDEEGTSGSVE